MKCLNKIKKRHVFKAANVFHSLHNRTGGGQVLGVFGGQRAFRPIVYFFNSGFFIALWSRYFP
jgi:hypothetical protein